MTGVELAQDFYRHMEWADALVWTAVLAGEGARDDARMRDLLMHTHLVQHAFLRTWTAVPPETPYPKFEELSPLLAWAREFHAAVPSVLDTFTLERCAAPLAVAWAALAERRLGLKAGVTTGLETLLQCALHAQYHRGQINARLRECNGQPPMVDYIVWIWAGRPAAVWPEGAAPVA